LKGDEPVSKNDIGIDLGTANTLIYLKSKGVVLNEPSVVAVKNGKILAVGSEAKKMLGRTPELIKAVRPLKNGVISDFEYTGFMLGYFVRKILRKHRGMKPDAVICIPAGVTGVERKAMESVAGMIGMKRLRFVEEPMAAAIGAGLDVMAPSGSMIVDIGGGTSEIAVISLGGIVVSRTVKIGGDSLDAAIIKYIRKKYGILAGEGTAEMLKMKIGTVQNGSNAYRELLCGRNVFTGMPCSTYVTGEDVRCALVPEISLIVENIKSVLEETPPELSADVLSSGIMLTGGGSLITGLDRLICEATGMPVRIADNPLASVATGAGMILEGKFDIDSR